MENGLHQNNSRPQHENFKLKQMKYQDEEEFIKQIYQFMTPQYFAINVQVQDKRTLKSHILKQF